MTLWVFKDAYHLNHSISASVADKAFERYFTVNKSSNHSTEKLPKITPQPERYSKTAVN